MKEQKTIVIAGREIENPVKDSLPLMLATLGIGGWLSDFTASLKSEALLYANIVALISVVYIFLKAANIIIGWVVMWYKGESSEYRRNKREYEMAKKEFQEEAERLEELSKKLDDLMDSKPRRRFQALRGLRDLGKTDE